MAVVNINKEFGKKLLKGFVYAIVSAVIVNILVILIIDWVNPSKRCINDFESRYQDQQTIFTELISRSSDPFEVNLIQANQRAHEAIGVDYLREFNKHGCNEAIFEKANKKLDNLVEKSEAILSE